MIGFFGKLPGSADFIAHNASHKDIRELDGWWQRALNRMAERDEDWQAHFDALPLCFFHYRASGGAWLMGAMAPSQDASGRRYPLLVFQRLAVAPVVEGTLGVHTLSETFAGQLRELLRDVQHFADPQAAQGRLIEGVEALRELDDSDLKLHRRLFARFLDDVRYVDLTRALANGFPEVQPEVFAGRMQALRERVVAGGADRIALPLPPERALKRPAADLWLFWLEHDNGPRARVSVIVDDFMRPRLLRFTRDDHDALRVLSGTVALAGLEAPDRAALERKTLEQEDDVSRPTIDSISAADRVPHTLGMGAYIAAITNDTAEHAMAERMTGHLAGRDSSNTFKDGSAST